MLRGKEDDHLLERALEGFRFTRSSFRAFGRADHRQDMKGTRWMPWHLESTKGVDGCDKPRLAAEQALTRGYPNGETRHR